MTALQKKLNSKRGDFLTKGEALELIAEVVAGAGAGATMDFDTIFPVGSIYTTTNDAFDPNATFGGTWVRVEEGRFMEAGSGANGKTKKEAGLPEFKGTAQLLMVANAKQSQACTLTGAGRMQLGISAGSNAVISDTVQVSANNGNRIYGQSNTVQPKSYIVNIWERTA